MGAYHLQFGQILYSLEYNEANIIQVPNFKNHINYFIFMYYPI